MRRRTVEKERFKVRDADGDIHLVIYSVEQVEATELGDTVTQWVDTIGQLQLADGGAVNKVSDTEFELVSLGGIKATRI